MIERAGEREIEKQISQPLTHPITHCFNPQLPPSDITPGLVVPAAIEYVEAVRRIELLQAKVAALREEIAELDPSTGSELGGS